MSDIEVEDAVVVDCELDAAPEKVWRALTVPELAARWLDGPEGHSYALIDAEPCTRVRYAWNDPDASEPATVVTIDLSPMPEGRTRFRLTHGIAARTPVAANANRSPMARAA
jgi:uncharacterized protein YndB with AHSA1/START domain